MTSRGRLIAFLIGVAAALALPKHVDCGVPGGSCQHAGTHRGEVCTPYEVEPWGVYLIEVVAGRDLGIAYTSGEDCR